MRGGLLGGIPNSVSLQLLEGIRYQLQFARFVVPPINSISESRCPRVGQEYKPINAPIISEGQRV